MLAIDPDGLLVEEKIQQLLLERGYHILLFDEPITFRYVYESRYRSRWDDGEHTCLIVVTQSDSVDVDTTIPYDIIQSAHCCTFSLSSLFPKLHYQVIASLDRSTFDVLYQVQTQQGLSVALSESETKDVVLRHAFEIVPECINQPVDLIRMLMRRHYRGLYIPDMLDQRLIHIIKQRDCFTEWSLEQIVPNRDDFFQFLQERWHIFVERVLQEQQQTDQGIGEHRANYAPTMLAGPLHLPFDHEDIRIYTDTLFLEGMLHPITTKKKAEVLPPWMLVGIQTHKTQDRWQRLQRLIESIEQDVPHSEARHHEWLTFAYRYAEVDVLWHQTEEEHRSDERIDMWIQRLRLLQNHIDEAFQYWLLKRYHALHNHPAMPPIMVHHIPRYLARRREQQSNLRTALLVLDGLSLGQWVVLRNVLLEHMPEIKLQEQAIFAWIPTITSVSRQAIFAGKPPIYYPVSIHTTSREESFWKQFWTERGIRADAIAYMVVSGDDTDLAPIAEILSKPRIQVVGLVVSKVDKISHGIELGLAGMYNQVQQWGEQSFLRNLISLLLDQQFDVVLTSDHGNVEAVGWGRPSEGAIADIRGERARIYSDSSLRASVAQRFSGSMEWSTIGLPEHFLSLLAPRGKAFVQKGETIVAHGGSTLEEVIVPFVHLEKKKGTIVYDNKTV